MLDIWMPDTDGVSLLKEWGSQGLLDMPVIMMSGHATVDTAVEATRIGAMDFLEKPITLQKLLKTVQTGLARPHAKQVMAAAGVTPAPRFAAAPVKSSAAPTAPVAAVAAPAGAAVLEAVPQQQGSMLGNITLDQPLRDARDEFERVYFEYHLGRENHSMTRVSEKTGLERTHLYRKLRQLGIDSSRKRNS